MPSTSLVSNLRKNYPEFTFQTAHVSRWSPRDQTVYYHDSRSLPGKLNLLHELGHAIRQHQHYDQDIELLRLEREAWQTARELAPAYGLAIDDNLVESHIDSYREWIHARSRCPSCGQAGMQRSDLTYTCVLCGTEWAANDARQCGLKRYTKSQTS
jgi:hypothetical protein